MVDFDKSPGVGGEPEDLDGMLVRFLDAEVSAESGKETLVLLESSPEARERLEELSLSSYLFSDSLADLAIPAVPELDLRPTLFSFLAHNRLAAAIVLLLLSLSLLTPVRAWIVEGVRSVASGFLPLEEPAGSTPEAAPAPSTVSFVPTGPELLVAVQSRQTVGRLILVVVEGDRASGEASDPDAGVELLVLPRGIEVRNEPGSVAEYTVEVPRSLDRVRIRVGGREVAVRDVQEAPVGHTWVFDLSDPGS